MDQRTRELVRLRAGGRCEYCQLHEDDADYLAFHVEHIVAKQHVENDDLQNLSFACSECNFSKGPNLAGYLQGKVVPLFDPRRQSWKRHFRWSGAILVGRTQSGKATIRVLNINDPARVALREGLIEEGRFPPEDN